MDYIHQHFRISYRNGKTSGKHSVFGKFVGNKAYLFYYFLWLQEVPHFMTFAVPQLPAGALRQSKTSSVPVDPPASPNVTPGTTPASAKLMSKRKNRKTKFSTGVANLESSSAEKIAVMTEFAQKKKISQLIFMPLPWPMTSLSCLTSYRKRSRLFVLITYYFAPLLDMHLTAAR